MVPGYDSYGSYLIRAPAPARRQSYRTDGRVTSARRPALLGRRRAWGIARLRGQWVTRPAVLGPRQLLREGQAVPHAVPQVEDAAQALVAAGGRPAVAVERLVAGQR